MVTLVGSRVGCLDAFVLLSVLRCNIRMTGITVQGWINRKSTSKVRPGKVVPVMYPGGWGGYQV